MHKNKSHGSSDLQWSQLKFLGCKAFPDGPNCTSSALKLLGVSEGSWILTLFPNLLIVIAGLRLLDLQGQQKDHRSAADEVYQHPFKRPKGLGE